MPPPPRQTLSGPLVLGVALGLILLITLGVTTVALVTRRAPAPPPRPRETAPAALPAADGGARP
ncbi:MAG: hypothetical protein U0324_05820 [Polyangiales bacterium]